MFLLKKIVSALILPPLGPLLWIFAGLVLRNRARRLAAALGWTGALALLALSMPITADALHALLGYRQPVDLAAARSAQAIVVLAGGKREAAEAGGEALNGFSLQRVQYAAQLARRLPLPLLASGGAVFGGTPEAQLMREALERDFGVRVRWTESASRDTQQNARYAAQILRREGVGRVVLVTHAFHMARARREFAYAGIETVPAPVGVPAGSGAFSLVEQLPDMAALRSSAVALHELLGNLAARLR